MDPQLDNLCRDMWDRFGDMNPSEKAAIATKIAAWPNSVSSSKMNLPIGEAMLQLTADRDPEGGRVFLPFLCEVRVGSQQCEIENDDDSNGLNGFAPTIISPREESAVSKAEGSPPHSPQLRNVDGQELNMDFWVNSTVQQNAYTYGAEFPATSSTTPNSKKETAKVTIKAHFRTLLVTRSPSSGSLSLTYLKEKKKDKMLQKLGMKKGQVLWRYNSQRTLTVSEAEAGRRAYAFAGCFNRKNVVQRFWKTQWANWLVSVFEWTYIFLVVIIDGNAYNGIRYFQTSPQWQTHIKSFPIAFLTPNVCTAWFPISTHFILPHKPHFSSLFHNAPTISLLICLYNM